MDIVVEPINFNISQDLINHTKEQFAKLTTYNDQIVGADVYLKSLTETEEGEKVVEAKIFIPGKDLFISGKGTDFVSALQDCYETSKRQVRKAKEKVKDRHQERPDKV